MTHDELESELFNAIDHANMMIDSQELLKIAIEFSESFSERNFNRISLLLEIYDSHAECFTNEITFSLNRINDALLIIRQAIDNAQQDDNSATRVH